MAGCHAISTAAAMSRETPATPRFLFLSLLSFFCRNERRVTVASVLGPLMKPRWALLNQPSGFK